VIRLLKRRAGKYVTAISKTTWTCGWARPIRNRGRIVRSGRRRDVRSTCPNGPGGSAEVHRVLSTQGWRS
jgi:hypothetical protein